ncbi:MAG: hypothetical protein ABSG82_03765 [Sedimentisphaerales bacterium]|jgi:hypothetical protein
MKRKRVVFEMLVSIAVGTSVACLWIIFAPRGKELPLPLLVSLGIVVGIIVGIMGSIVSILRDRAHNIKFALEHLPASAADYIKLVIKYMRYTTIARQEVADELTDHFEAAIKNCATSKEKELKAQELIAEFGDAKLLGVLLRRAKKRCRPLWRTVAARTFQAVGILIICLILYIAWFLTGKPVISTDYLAELNKLVRPSADNSLNAAPLYHKARLALVDSNDLKEFLRLDFNDVNDRQKELIRQWLAKNQTPLELVAKGSELPYCWQQYRSDDPEQSMMSVLLPHLAPSRTIAYALCWRAWFSAADGNINSALRDIETCYRFGRHNKGEKILIEQLVGIAIEGKALASVRQLLDAYKIDSNTLADFQQRLQALIDTEDFKPHFQFEKLCMFDEIQRCFTESRFGPSHIYPKYVMELSKMDSMQQSTGLESALQKLLIVSQVLFTHPDKAKSIAMTNALYKFWNENVAKTPALLRAEQIDTQAESNRLTRSNLILQMLAPALVRVNMIAWRNKVDADSTLVTIALVRYRQDTGSYPESLEKLAERGYIKQVPIDPFSDGPLSYKKTEEGCLLYSWGENLTDDGGQIARDKEGKIKKFAPEGDWVFSVTPSGVPYGRSP